MCSGPTAVSCQVFPGLPDSRGPVGGIGFPPPSVAKRKSRATEKNMMGEKSPCGRSGALGCRRGQNRLKFLANHPPENEALGRIGLDPGTFPHSEPRRPAWALQTLRTAFLRRGMATFRRLRRLPRSSLLRRRAFPPRCSANSEGQKKDITRLAST